MPAKQKPPAFVKENALKAEIKRMKFRSTAEAVDKIVAVFNGTMQAVVEEAVKRAKAGRRTTVLEEDAQAALEKHVGKSDLEWGEITAQILDETAADLGKITKGIQDYVREKSKPTG